MQVYLSGAWAGTTPPKRRLHMVWLICVALGGALNGMSARHVPSATGALINTAPQSTDLLEKACQKGGAINARRPRLAHKRAVR